MFNFLQQVQVMQWMTLADVLVKWSVILMDVLGPDISWERTSFASWESTFESSSLFIGLKLSSDQKVASVFATFEWN